MFLTVLLLLGSWLTRITGTGCNSTELLTLTWKDEAAKNKHKFSQIWKGRLYYFSLVILGVSQNFAQEV